MNQSWKYPGRVVALSASLMLVACGASRQGAPRHYAQSMDSPSNACRHNAALCVPGPREQMPVVPPVKRLHPSCRGGRLWPLLQWAES
jgi:hypothetical protein